jgi:hypothetical protein
MQEVTVAFIQSGTRADPARWAACTETVVAQLPAFLPQL